MNQDFWKRCSTCKKEIALQGKFYRCSVSTCNTKRTGYVFCSVNCFERHLPGAKHRDAFAIEEQAPKYSSESATPSQPANISENSAATTPTRRIVTSKPASSKSSGQKPPPRETLIVASKLKDYIRIRSEMNTSSSVLTVLSDKVRILCDEAIDQARSEGRKTVLDRDFQ